MLKKNIKTDEPIKVTVGDVTFTILRIGERVVSVGVDAPRNIPIAFGTICDEKAQDSCGGATECAT